LQAGSQGFESPRLHHHLDRLHPPLDRLGGSPFRPARHQRASLRSGCSSWWGPPSARPLRRGVGLLAGGGRAWGVTVRVLGAACPGPGVRFIDLVQQRNTAANTAARSADGLLFSAQGSVVVREPPGARHRIRRRGLMGDAASPVLGRAAARRTGTDRKAGVSGTLPAQDGSRDRRAVGVP
jgi:hypothetical protein